MNIFISLHQYSEPTFLTTLKSTKIARYRTRSAFNGMKHDLRFLITTVYAFSIRVPILESVQIYGRNRNDLSPPPLSLSLCLFPIMKYEILT